MKNNPFQHHPHAKIFIIAGVSGVGKSTLIEGIVSGKTSIKNIQFVITHTSRDPRMSKKGVMEQDGVEYYFVSYEKILDMVQNDEFAENNNPYESKKIYGTSLKELARIVNSGNNGITDLDVDGAINLKNLFPNNVYTIFIQPESVDQAIQQLKDRASDDAKALESRLARFNYEMGLKDSFDSIVTNISGQPDVALQEVANIIKNQIAT
jgi:guanylate kinase